MANKFFLVLWATSKNTKVTSHLGQNKVVQDLHFRKAKHSILLFWVCGHAWTVSSWFIRLFDIFALAVVATHQTLTRVTLLGKFTRGHAEKDMNNPQSYSFFVQIFK
jgi:hypothetical protein